MGGGSHQPQRGSKWFSPAAGWTQSQRGWAAGIHGVERPAKLFEEWRQERNKPCKPVAGICSQDEILYRGDW